MSNKYIITKIHNRITKLFLSKIDINDDIIRLDWEISSTKAVKFDFETDALEFIDDLGNVNYDIEEIEDDWDVDWIMY